MSMAYFKSIFVVLSLLSVILMTWFIGPFSHPVVEHPESMYFYEYEPVYKQNFDFTLRERLKCEDNLFLVILVTSRLQELKSRQAIRQTWGSQKSWWGNQVRTLFLLGQGEETEGNSVLSIEDESVLYGDILRQDFFDSYNNLTLKTIMGFRWVAEFCSNAHYVMKTDSDVFVNTGNLVKFLLSSNASENFITGYPFVDNPALREVFLKNYISYEDYPFKTYPPYLSGLGYVLDTRLAVRVYEMMSHIKPIKFEDVYVGLCLNRLSVNISMPEDTNLFFLKKISFDICKYKHLIAVHGIYPQEMIKFWQEITRETSVTCS